MNYRIGYRFYNTVEFEGTTVYDGNPYTTQAKIDAKEISTFWGYIGLTYCF